MNSIQSIFDIMMKLDAKKTKVPDIVLEKFSIDPETVLECLDYFEGIIQKTA